MSWLGRLFSTTPRLSAAHAAAVQAYRDREPVGADAQLDTLRFVVVDVETSGLDPRRDRLLAIGAVAVSAGATRFEDSFHALLRQARTSTDENILVHGIGGTSQVTAPDAAEGLADFLAFAGTAPLVAFHADFDRVAIGRAMRAELGLELANPWLDAALLAPALIPEHQGLRSLDDWMLALGIENFRRHDAVADALATAQIFQIVLARSVAGGGERLSDLEASAAQQRWLARTIGP